MYNQYQVIALVCCRGGSKGIPGKNIKDFHGKPLLGWILEAAREAAVFDEIVLSTDSQEIADVGSSYGATIPGLRPAHLASDTSDVFDTHKYVFGQLNVTDETHRVCIVTNNPFIDAGLIRKGYEKAVSFGFERVVLDVALVGGDFMHFRQCEERGGLLHHLYPDVMLGSTINRQAAAPVYSPINNTRWGKPSVMAGYEQYKVEVATNGFAGIYLPKTRNIDLDDMEDWLIGEAVFERSVLK